MLKHVKRSQSTIAHELSHHARRVNSSAVWLADVLECIKHLVLKDCNDAITENQLRLSLLTKIKLRIFFLLKGNVFLQGKVKSLSTEGLG